ncbi:MAG: SH3 domain-containing protein [Thermomicrobiales bacterium]
MPRPALRPSRWFVSILILCLIAATLALQPHARAATDLTLGADAEVADAQGDSVNIRDQPSYSGSVITSVPEGWLVNVVDGPFTDDSDGTLWYQVVGNGLTGYMLSDYLRTPDGSVSAAAVMTTTAALNLRSGPGTTYSVLLVMPNGATVNTTGTTQNGFSQLTYNGTTGWASTQYLSGGTGSTTATVIDGSLNLRSGPATTYSVVTVMPDGATVTITGALTNGFYPVRYGSLTGYAFAQYLQIGSNPTPTATPTNQTAIVIDGALNLRSGPGTTYSVVTVMPDGATVTITGALNNGFYPVRYGSTNGYAFAQYLQIGGTPSSPTPTATATTQPTRAAWTTANLNLRSGTGSSFGVIMVIPSGAGITVTGSLSNNYYPVTYNGTSGYASADYITFSQPTTPTPGTGGLLIWPVKGGTWQIIQGYNGGTHNGSTYMYSMDLQRTDGEQATIGQTIYAPASGTVLWTSGGLLIGMNNGYGIALFHITLNSNITSGTVVTQGQVIGSISGPGGSGYQVTPHVDMTLWQLPNGGGTPRISTPFTGQFTISGNDFPPGNLAYNTWGGTIFTP